MSVKDFPYFITIQYEILNSIIYNLSRETGVRTILVKLTQLIIRILKRR